jgi:hypothetical protein
VAGALEEVRALVRARDREAVAELVPRLRADQGEREREQPGQASFHRAHGDRTPVSSMLVARMTNGIEAVRVADLVENVYKR